MGAEVLGWAKVIAPLVGGLIGMSNKPETPSMPAPQKPAEPPQEAKAPDRGAISAEERAASTLFGRGPERAPISTADMTLGKSSLKGNDVLGA